MGLAIHEWAADNSPTVNWEFTVLGYLKVLKSYISFLEQAKNITKPVFFMKIVLYSVKYRFYFRQLPKFSFSLTHLASYKTGCDYDFTLEKAINSKLTYFLVDQEEMGGFG